MASKTCTTEGCHFKALYEREKRKNEQYSRDMEVELNKRDEQLEKREHEIFEMEEHRQRLLAKVDLLQKQSMDENKRSESLTQQLESCKQELQEERNKTQPNQYANDTALFEAEAKVEEWKATVEKLKADANFYLNANCDLTSQKEQLEDQLATALSDADKLKELIRCQQDDVKREHERAQELEIQLHQLQTEAGGEMAPRGNSLFAEVIDGKERLEKEFALLHQQNRQLRNEVNRAMRLACENATNKIGATNGETLNGPTLAIFKLCRAQLQNWLGEKQVLLEKLHALEEAERRNVLKMAAENPLEFNIFQENIHSMTMHAKQRAESRAVQLELREMEFLKTIAYEKQRAASVPQLEYRIKQLERIVAHYEQLDNNNLGGNFGFGMR